MNQQLVFTCAGPDPAEATDGDCSVSIEVPFTQPLTRDSLAKFLRDRAWFISVERAPGPERYTPIVLTLICESCAKKSMPELVEAAKKVRRQK